VRTDIASAIDYWDKAANTATNLSNGDGTVLPILRSLVSLAALRRRALFVDFPSLRAKGERNLQTFSNAYEELEATIAEIEVARASAPGVSAMLELRRNSKIALFALFRLEAAFLQYKYGWIVANGLVGESNSYTFALGLDGVPVTTDDPVATILIGEKWSN